jgi:hypothetical protein
MRAALDPSPFVVFRLFQASHLCHTDGMQPEPVTQPVARRWYGPLLAGDLAALWPAIVVAFLAVLGVAFGMSFHGLFVFGELIMGWALGLCIAAPIGLDVFSLLCLIAAFLTRDAHWRVRLYCWLFLGVTVSLSIAGNAISAYAVLDAVATRRGETFVWGYQQVSAIVGAAFWPLLSAIALHVLIVVRRHLDERRDRIRADVARVRAEQDTEELQQARAVVLAAAGKPIPDILEDLSTSFGYTGSRRTVERWTETVRTSLATAPPKTSARGNGRRVEKPAAGTVPAQ